MTYQFPGGRHRAPSRIATALTQGRYSATSTFSVAASGGILASSVLVATTAPQQDVEAAMASLAPVTGHQPVAADRPADAATDAAAFAATTTALSRSLDAVALPGSVPLLSERIDRPAKAVAAPADAEMAAVGQLGFVGITPVAETVVEPTDETAAAATAADARDDRTASRSESRSPAPAPAPAPAPSPAPAPAPSPAPAPAPAPAPEPTPPPSSGAGEAAIGWANNHLGLPYIWGSDSGAGYDCSGFVRAAYASAGVSLPHGSSAQYSATSRVSLDHIQRGDLLFYSNGGDIFHVAIYLGGGQVIHSLRDWSGGFSGSKITGMNYSPGLFAAGRP